MVMNAFDTTFDAGNEVYAVNTVAFHYMKHPIEIDRARPVRIYLVNITEFDPINSFHLHANFFDYYDPGTPLEPTLRMVDTIMQAQASARHPGVLLRRITSRGSTCSTPTSPNSPSSAGWASSMSVSTASWTRWSQPSRERTRERHPDFSRRAPSSGAVVPLLLLAAVLAWIVRTDAGLGDRTVPPIETLSVQRVILPAPNEIELDVVNDGPDPITIAQVLVDEAYWQFRWNRLEPSTGCNRRQSLSPIPGSRVRHTPLP